MVFLIQPTMDRQGLWARLQSEDFRALTPLFYGHINPTVGLSWTWRPVVPESDVTVPFRMRVYRTFPPVAP